MDNLPSAARSLRDQILKTRPELAALRFHFIAWFIAAAVAVTTIVTFGLLVFYPHTHAIFPLAVLLPLLFCWGLFTIADHFYREKTRQLITETLVFTSGFNSLPNGFSALREMAAHAIFPSGEDIQVGNGFEGQYNTVSFALQSVTLAENRMRRQFVVARINLKRSVAGHTVILSRGLRLPILDRVASYGKIAAPGRFEKIFEIFTTDRTESRMIADSALFERLSEACAVYKARWLAVSFLSTEIVFVLESRDSPSEPLHLWSAIKPSLLYGFYERFEVFFKLIDVLRASRQLLL